MIANFTIEQLIQEVKRLAEQNPDFVYQIWCTSCEASCFYTKSKTDPNKGCIFGQAILNLQPELKELLQKVDDPRPDDASSVSRIKDLIQQWEIKASIEQLDWCDDVQSAQDQEFTWANAVNFANRNHPNFPH